MGFIHIIAVTLVFLMFIRSSLLKPQTQPSSVACADVLSKTACKEIKANGLCPKNGLDLCKETCRLCPKPDEEGGGSSPRCQDQNSQCPGWTALGECEANPVFMHGACAESCGTCIPTKTGCGSYSAISHMIVANRVRDNSHLVLNEHGGMASLHSSKTDLHSRTAKCGAVLVSDRYLLTAAHCMAASEGLISISLGRNNLDESTNPSSDTYQICEIHIHPHYNGSRNSYNDLAIIKTERKVKFSKNIWPYCLPDRNQVLVDFMTLQISGWGLVNETHRASVLKTAFVNLVMNPRCISIWQQYGIYDDLQLFSYPQGLTRQIVCAGRHGVDACEGDSGGPLCHLNKKGLKTVIGLVSKGVALCPEIPVIPGLYTNVVEYLDWIQEITDIQQLSSLSSSRPQSDTFCPAAPGSLDRDNGGSATVTSDGCGIRKLQPQNTNPLEAGFGEFPWMTRITDQSGNWVAYGALISSNWVLTLAHNVQGHTPQSLKVRVGALHRVTLTALNQLAEEVPVDQIISHPQYKQVSSDGIYVSRQYNVALLHLAKSVNMDGHSHIVPVCLPRQGDTFTGQRCWVTGWWREKTLTGADDRSVLQKESLPILEPIFCEQKLRSHSTTPQSFALDKLSSLCAGGEQGKNVCVGGAAPLVCEGSNGHYVLVGLSSWYVGTAEDTCVGGNNPHVYSNIPNMVDFIKQNTGI